MGERTASSFLPYLRSCKEESDGPIEGELKGEIPKWLKGNLIRVGSGLLEVGPDRYNHLFDGLALIHKFSFQGGKVTYRNKFLRSDAYRQSMKAKRIVMSEFGTNGIPDPCKTIFQRFASLFDISETTDNDLVNIVLYADEPYACSETNCIWKIDPETLESIEKVKFSNFVPVNVAIAHAHKDRDGTVYNVGSTFSFYCNYRILKFPPKENKSDNTFQNASVVCSIPSSKTLALSYHHSFGMSKNYFIFVEQPLYLSISKVAFFNYFGGGTFADSLSWDESKPCRFHVVRRSDGKLMDTVYVSKSFFVFHHINAYEEDNNLVVDMCTFDDGEIINVLYIKALEDLFKNHKSIFDFKTHATRYVLPLSIDEKIDCSTNLVSLSKSSATALRREDGSIFLTSEFLTGDESWSPELPRINYEKFNGRKYKYFYAMAKNGTLERTQLIKGDVENKTTISWSEEGAIPSEPVFISEPDPVIEDEDSGILLASLLYTEDESKVSMLVLNAKTMEEIGRVTFFTKSSVPADFHGSFIAEK